VPNGWVTLRPMLAYLKDRITTALIRSCLIDARRITVTAAGSRVILTGTVRSWEERQEAERVAWSAPGVTQVENRIKCGPDPTAERCEVEAH
jgi:osmotically-inducible protein OsmY